ncbi:MAG: pyridoxal-phosphate dependent enzyme [Acidobacteriia bacterium]|nr:pyridoxal-phosphate dependent enzyme [Terriglobia bacterium]
MTSAALREVLARFPSLPLVPSPTLIEPMPRLASMLGGGPRLLIKRDDAIAFGFGGNKVRKLAFVGGRAQADEADTLITAGGVQSNHARVTAAIAAKLGMRAVLVANGREPDPPTGNALIDRLLGAEVVYVNSREARAPKILEIAERLRGEGRKPYAIPIGASIPLGALGYALAMAELVDQMPAPDIIVHATSSGGTQAGLVAGCRLLGLSPRVIGVSADDSAVAIQAHVRRQALARNGDRSGRSLRRRRLRHSNGRVTRSDRSRGADRSDLSRSDVHGQGDGEPHRVRAPAEIRGRADRVVLAHGRTGGAVRVRFQIAEFRCQIDLLLDVTLEHLPPDDRAVNIPLPIDADALRAGMIRRRRF